MKKIILYSILLYILITCVLADKIGSYCYSFNSDFPFLNTSSPNQYIGIAHLNAQSCPSHILDNGTVNCSAGWDTIIHITALNFTLSPEYANFGYVLKEVKDVNDPYPTDFSLYVYDYAPDMGHTTIYQNTSTERHWEVKIPSSPTICKPFDMYKSDTFQCLLSYIPSVTKSYWYNATNLTGAENWICDNDTVTIISTTTTTTTTTTTLGICSMGVQAKYQNGSYVENANISAKCGGYDYQLEYQGDGIYTRYLYCFYCDVFGELLPTFPYKKYLSLVWANGDYQIFFEPDYEVDKINTTFNIFDYGNIPMENNRVSVYQCDDETYCQSLLWQCQKISSDSYTNSTGYYKFTDLTIDKDYACGRTQYLDINHDIDDRQSIYIDHSQNVDFNFSYGLSTNQYEVCVGFQDSLSYLIIENVDVVLKQNNIIKFSGSTGASNFCFNVSSTTPESLTFSLTANKVGYKPLLLNIQLELGTNVFLMDQAEGNVSEEFKHFVQGYVLEGETPKSNKKVKATCGDLYTTSNNTGSYQFNDIVRYTDCCFQVVDAGYTSTKPCITVTENVTNLNITITQKTTGEYDVSFYIVEPDIYEGQYKDVVGAKITLTSFGNITSCITKTNGKCIIYNVIYDKLYYMDIEKDGYKNHSESLYMKDNEYKIIIYPIEEEWCGIKGYTRIENGSSQNPIQVEVFLSDEYGKLIKSVTSSQLGYYEFNVQCGENYKVESTYGGQEIAKLLKIPSGEGSEVGYDFIFSSSSAETHKGLESFKEFFIAIFIPFLYVFVVILGFLILKWMSDAFMDRKD